MLTEREKNHAEPRRISGTPTTGRIQPFVKDCDFSVLAVCYAGLSGQAQPIAEVAQPLLFSRARTIENGLSK